MPVFRVERTRDYTVMSNYHLRDKRLTLKAKGLLSQMLSLPEDWDYTLSGLSHINRESKDAIRSAVNELERAGYVNTVGGKGCFVAETNRELIREEHLKEIEAHMSEIVKLAKSCGLKNDTLVEMFKLLELEE